LLLALSNLHVSCKSHLCLEPGGIAYSEQVKRTGLELLEDFRFDGPMEKVSTLSVLLDGLDVACFHAETSKHTEARGESIGNSLLIGDLRLGQLQKSLVSVALLAGVGGQLAECLVDVGGVCSAGFVVLSFVLGLSRLGLEVLDAVMGVVVVTVFGLLFLHVFSLDRHTADALAHLSDFLASVGMLELILSRRSNLARRIGFALDWAQLARHLKMSGHITPRKCKFAVFAVYDFDLAHFLMSRKKITGDSCI